MLEASPLKNAQMQTLGGRQLCYTKDIIQGEFRIGSETAMIFKEYVPAWLVNSIHTTDKEKIMD